MTHQYNDKHGCELLGKYILRGQVRAMPYLPTEGPVHPQAEQQLMMVTSSWVNVPEIRDQRSFVLWLRWMNRAEIELDKWAAACSPLPPVDLVWKELTRKGVRGGDGVNWYQRFRNAAFHDLGDMAGHQLALETLVNLHPAAFSEPLEYMKIYCVLCELTGNPFNLEHALKRICNWAENYDPQISFDTVIQTARPDLAGWSYINSRSWSEARARTLAIQRELKESLPKATAVMSSSQSTRSVASQKSNKSAGSSKSSKSIFDRVRLGTFSGASSVSYETTQTSR
ncbi:hypothetical protein CJU90_6266 [Yarrowia sp. C11]|nr:hypothetical protein CJU90_6266 [Yarrowia sp. C11]KAG5370971.1 hypothetical protein CKK34_1106 [Yarrowia sp. E02]